MSMFKHLKRLPIWVAERDCDGDYSLEASANWIFVITDDYDLCISEDALREGIRMEQCLCEGCRDRAEGKKK